MSPSIRHQPTVLDVVVVGAGLGGLSAAIAVHENGHNVLVLESAKILREIGAGVLISPNATRELIRWGIEEDIKDLVVTSRTSRVLRWKDGAVLSEVNIDRKLGLKKFQAPTWGVHRADLHQALLRRVKQLGIEIRLDAKVVRADADKASVTLHTGEEVLCDFVVGADGIRSTVRDILCEKPAPAQPTGDYAFQFALEVEKYRNDKHIAPLIEGQAATAWWGPGRHVIATMLYVPCSGERPD